jgi:hypothetical protein
MKKRSNIIKIIGALTVLSLLLAIVFAPYRGSYKGTYFDKTLAKMDVNFGGKIINANVDAKNNIAVVNDLSTPTTAAKKRKVNASQIYSETLAKSSNESFGNTTSGVLVSNSNTNANIADNGNSTNSETTVGVFAPTPTFSTSLIKGSNNQIASAGTVSSTVDLTGVNISGSQAGPQGAGGAGGPPPEEGGGIPPSLPIGNGINFLLILATFYGGWKLRKSFIA